MWYIRSKQRWVMEKDNILLLFYFSRILTMKYYIGSSPLKNSIISRGGCACPMLSTERPFSCLTRTEAARSASPSFVKSSSRPASTGTSRFRWKHLILSNCTLAVKRSVWSPMPSFHNFCMTSTTSMLK
jgi:hypothetical protein